MLVTTEASVLIDGLLPSHLQAFQARKPSKILTYQRSHVFIIAYLTCVGDSAPSMEIHEQGGNNYVTRTRRLEVPREIPWEIPPIADEFECQHATTGTRTVPGVLFRVT